MLIGYWSYWLVSNDVWLFQVRLLAVEHMLCMCTKHMHVCVCVSLSITLHCIQSNLLNGKRCSFPSIPRSMHSSLTRLLTNMQIWNQQSKTTQANDIFSCERIALKQQAIIYSLKCSVLPGFRFCFCSIAIVAFTHLETHTHWTEE